MVLSNLRTFIHHTEEIILSILLFFLILLSCIQISMRLFFDSGFIWADPLLRYVVLWSGMLGAVLAVAQGKHISLDISGYLLPKKTIRYLHIVLHLFSCIICGFLTFASWLFLKSEMEFGGNAILSIPSWIWNLIFPIAFGLMTLRYLSSALMVAMGTSKSTAAFSHTQVSSPK